MSAYKTLNPATGKTEKTFPSLSDRDMYAKLDKAHGLWRDDWQHRSFADRSRIVKGAADALLRDKEKHARIITTDMGKVLSEAVREIELTAAILTYYAENAEEFLAPRELPVEKGKAKLINQPLGVIYCVEPWNFPYYQLARVAAPNLMAGNTVMVKHAESVPQCALAFEALFRDAGAPEGAYTNLFISNDQSEKLIEKPEIRGVALTGSERAGSAVAAQAGKALKKSTMELGGTDAFIVLEDADLDKVMQCAVTGRMGNNGQVCTAAKRMIVHESLADTFIERLKAEISKFRYGDPLDPNVTHGPMSSEGALKRALEQVDRAVKGGAKLVGGKKLEREGFFMEAGILTNVTRDNPLFYEEIFGPVATIHRVKSEDEAIALANDSPYGLGGSVYTRDIERGLRVAEKVETGMMYVNMVTATQPDLPFGGIKNSGYGRELSSLGIEEFVNRKLIRVA
ncbi:NAD-dependent succinate-semialdehyde dehydrogenase [Brytella acorum]|uniref:NAD-dependent succinate-semialdehyde dehydrogenase n=1 Tax=Brytella acorum TaxID=2959299 RepID=A0AA35UFX9_9PROT|nr:NAD-dependent succinate-semialdehyde dehydrogenase [Brytella acorum]MDF3623369.1 NAD-dependent succinate-semialdehyde dehydrogenase [Brytella acorum]CAI9120475.1 NAD-dependent succinate-semialdehyde dehydrogenase [Brytella acorum]